MTHIFPIEFAFLRKAEKSFSKSFDVWCIFHPHAFCFYVVMVIHFNVFRSTSVFRTETPAKLDIWKNEASWQKGILLGVDYSFTFTGAMAATTRDTCRYGFHFHVGNIANYGPLGKQIKFLLNRIVELKCSGSISHLVQYSMVVPGSTLRYLVLLRLWHTKTGVTEMGIF